MALSPMGASPFAPLHVTPSMQRRFEDLAEQMLDRTVRSYDQFVVDGQRLADKKRWKQIRSEANASVYVKRSGDSSCASNPNVAWRGLDQPMEIIGLGRCGGSVDDMLLALGGTDMRQSLISAAYLGRKISDGAMLARLKAPTDEDPFRLLAVQWLAYPAPAPLDRIIKTRDYVFLLVKGMTRRANGDVIGYELMQSIDLAECPSLEAQHSYIRGRMMLGVVMKQRPDHSVDVFFETFVESNGTLSNKIAQYYSSSALASLFRLEETAKRRKLAWFVNTARRSLSVPPEWMLRSVYSTVEEPSCSVCSKLLTSPRKARRCLLCQSQLCSKCRQVVELKNVTFQLELVVDQVVVCECCLHRAEATSATEIARRQHHIGFEGEAKWDGGELQSNGSLIQTTSSSESRTSYRAAAFSPSSSSGPEYYF